MKKIILTLTLIGLILTACGQSSSQTFNKIIIATKGIQFGDGTIQLTAATGTGSSTVDWSNILNKPLTFAPTTHNHDALYRPITWFPTFAQVTSKPTTLSGYGITDAALSNHSHSALYKPLSYVPTWNEVTLKPAFAIVATTGSYVDLINKPETEDLSVAINSFLGNIQSLTTVQINALVPTGVKIVHDSTLNTLKVYIGGVWKTIILSE